MRFWRPRCCESYPATMRKKGRGGRNLTCGTEVAARHRRVRGRLVLAFGPVARTLGHGRRRTCSGPNEKEGGRGAGWAASARWAKTARGRGGAGWATGKEERGGAQGKEKQAEREGLAGPSGQNQGEGEFLFSFIFLLFQNPFETHFKILLNHFEFCVQIHSSQSIKCHGMHAQTHC